MAGHVFSEGQLVRIVRSTNGTPCRPVRARIVNFKRQLGNDKQYYDCEVALIDPVSVRATDGTSKTAEEFEVALCRLSQLDPYEPDGAAPSKWENCVWKPTKDNV